MSRESDMTEPINEPETPESGSTEAPDGPLLSRQSMVKATKGPKVTLLPTPQRPPKRPALKTATACKLELGKIYRQSKFGLIPLETACKLTYMLTSIVKIIDSADIERRLKALEQEENRHAGAE
jgi:hypothetical protein